MTQNESRPEWLFDEYSGHRWMNVAEVEAYEATIKPDLAVERDVLRSLGLASHHRLIDFGAGTGVRTLEAAAMCERVIAVDPSAAMLDYMRIKAERRNMRNVEYVERGFLTYEHVGEPVDYAVTRHALHLLPDFWKVEALRRVFEVLKPGGIFFAQELVYSFEPEDAAMAINRWIGSVPEDGRAGFERSFFEEHVREKYGTYSWLFEAMLAKVGFEVRSVWFSETQAHARYTCVKPA